MELLEGKNLSKYVGILLKVPWFFQPSNNSNFNNIIIIIIIVIQNDFNYS